MAYFTQFPTLLYDVEKTNKDVLVTDLFFRYRIRDEIKNNLVTYNKFSVRDHDTPENLAQKINGDPHLYWIILKMNDIVNINEDWPKSQRELNRFVDDKYPGKARMVSNMGTSDFTIGEDVTTVEGYLSLEDDFDTAEDSEPRILYERTDVEKYMVQETVDNPASGIINSIDKTNFNIGSKTSPTHKVIITEADGTFSNGDVITGRDSNTTATIVSTVANTDADHHFEDESNLLTSTLKSSEDHIKTLKDLYKEVPRNRRNGTPVTILGAICKLLINDYFLEKPYDQQARSDYSFDQLQTQFLWTDYHRSQIS